MLFCRFRFLPDKQRSAVHPSLQSAVCSTPTALRFMPQHCLYFLPLPHGHEIVRIYLCRSTLLRRVRAQTHPCSFRSPSLPAHAQPSARCVTWIQKTDRYPPGCSPIMASNISNPAILYSTSGSLWP